MPVIEVEHLTKEYRLGALQGLKQTLLNTGMRLAGKAVPERPLFKALDDVSFSIEQGEVVGIIGHNGAGKSTLLKMLARISTPTHGKVKVDGRIAPLIEVGAGFVPDFTGRENIYLNAAILGMSKEEIHRKIEEIIEFSGIAQFIDTPVKRYSSGMQVKLAFSVATSVDAEILIIDEVLAVGDLAFQRKCFDRIEDLIKRQKRTVLLVSHNIRQVERLCSRAVLLDRGKILHDSTSHDTCNKFYEISNNEIQKQISRNNSARVTTSGEINDIFVGLLAPDESTVSEARENSTLRIAVKFTTKHALKNPEFHIGIHTTDFVYLIGESSAVLKNQLFYEAGHHKIEIIIPQCPLAPGTYGVRFAVIDERGRVLFHGENLSFFSITSMQEDSPLQDDLRLLSTPIKWRIKNQDFEYRYPPTTTNDANKIASTLPRREGEL